MHASCDVIYICAHVTSKTIPRRDVINLCDLFAPADMTSPPSSPAEALRTRRHLIGSAREPQSPEEEKDLALYSLLKASEYHPRQQRPHVSALDIRQKQTTPWHKIPSSTDMCIISHLKQILPRRLSIQNQPEGEDSNLVRNTHSSSFVECPSRKRRQ